MDPRFLPHNTHLEDRDGFAEQDPQLRLLARGVPPQAIFFFSGELIDDHHALLHLLQTQLAEMPADVVRYVLVDEVSYILEWDKAVKYATDAGLLEGCVLVLTGSDLVLIQEARMRLPGRRGRAATYSDWIRGDVIKRGRHEHYLREILDAVISRYRSQVTWNALARDLSIDHPKTVGDYAALLASMDALFIQPALLEDKLTQAPKKARKLMFTDPFIYHAVRSWLRPVSRPYEEQVQPSLGDPGVVGSLVEACVATHYRRLYPTCYIKGGGEVDVAYVHRNRFWPEEVKWSGQLRPKDLKQIAKHPNAVILTRSRDQGMIQNLSAIPVPLALARLG